MRFLCVCTHLCPHAAEKMWYFTACIGGSYLLVKALSVCSFSNGCAGRIFGGAVFKYAGLRMLSADGTEKKERRRTLTLESSCG